MSNKICYVKRKMLSLYLRKEKTYKPNLKKNKPITILQKMQLLCEC